MKIQAVLNAKAGQLYFILTCQFTGDFANVGVAAYLCTGKMVQACNAGGAS